MTNNLFSYFEISRERIFLTQFMFFILGLFVITSCGRRMEPVHPVRGQVLYHSKPATGAFVIFHPQDATEEVQKLKPYGTVGQDGYFTLRTYAPGDGAPLGFYNVTVQWPMPKVQIAAGPKDDQEGCQSSGDWLKGRYKDPKSSGLSATIVEGENNLKPFDLQ